MANDPQFASIVNIGAALLGAAETNLQVPTTTSVVVTAGSSGTKIEEIVIQATTTSLAATTVAGLVYLFLYDGTTYHLFDTVTVRAITGSSTVAPYRAQVTDFVSGSGKYQNLILKSGWSLKASQSIVGNASILKIEAFGADL